MRPCPVCSQVAKTSVGELTNTKIAPLARQNYDLLHCQDCDIVYLSPLPSARDLEILYVDELQFDYYDDNTTRVVVDFIKSRLEAVLDRLGMVTADGLTRPPAVLEIGAGLAWMGRAAKLLSPNALTVAQDITKEVADQCPWVNHYVVAPAEDKRLDALGPYDVISMTHVIEHLNDPAGMLRRLRPMTRGLVFMTAPHRPVKWDGSIEAWRKYSYNHVPGHLQYFSELGMRKMAEAAGYAVDHWDATAEEGQAFEAWLKPKS